MQVNPNAQNKVMVTDELLEKLDKDANAMTALAKSDPAMFKAVEEYLDNPEKSALAPADAQTSEATEISTKEDATVPKGFVPGEKYKAVADKASDFENKWKADQKRIKELTDRLAERKDVSTEAPKPEAVWSDENLINVTKTVTDLRKELDDLKAGKRIGDEAELIVTRKRLDDADFQNLGEEFKEFKSTESLGEMEARYAKFYYSVGGTQEDGSLVAKFFEDANFRKEMEAKGVKAPKDFDKLNTVLQVKALRDKLQSADPDTKMSDAYAVYMRRNKKLSAMLSEARLEGAAQVADRLHNNANETINMNPGATSATTSEGFSEAQMMEWMNKNPHPKTKTEIETFKRIEAYLDEKYPGEER